jgi:hypothetical protein
MSGRTDGRTDERTDGQIDGRTNERTNGQTDRHTEGLQNRPRRLTGKNVVSQTINKFINLEAGLVLP